MDLHNFIPLGVMTDSYKPTHYYEYPEANKMSAYGEFRAPFRGSNDDRFVWYGIRYLVEEFLNKQWKMEDIERLDKFYSTHNAGFTPFPYPKDIIIKFIKENNGYFPIRVEALPEGTVANIHTPVYQIIAEGPYSRLVTFFETILTHCWYPTTVATLSRRTKEVIAAAFQKSVDPEQQFLLESRLHDFGFRGCTSLEQSVIGGCAHLLNFTGTDTMSAAYYAQFHLNNGKPVGNSIPATEHSVMTAWKTEAEAIHNMIDKFGTGVFACVMDSYDYINALENVLPIIAKKKTEKGGFMVLRPDSGDPTEAVLLGIKGADKVFGHSVNKKGFKVLKGAGVIQGDGINYDNVVKILDAVQKEGYSASNVAFGMGGGLLQKVDRDTMSFATKLSYIEYSDGVKRDVMKKPKTDAGKISLPGYLQVKLVNGIPTAFPANIDGPRDPANILQIVYDKKPVAVQWEDFDALRKRVETQWKAIPVGHDAISSELRDKINKWHL